MHFETTDSLDLITSAAATLDVTVFYSNLNGTTVTPDDQQTAITTATTTPILTAPGAGVHKIKQLIVRNKHASLATDVTVVFNSTIDTELYKTTLLAGQTLEWNEQIGFYVPVPTAKLNAKKWVDTEYVNATTSFTDITGLTQTVESGKHYCFEARLFHQEDAATTGAQFGINGPAMTLLHLQELGVVIPSVTAATMQSSAGVAALDTAAVVATASATTPANHLAILSGYINPSASGTFAIRGKSEVAVANGLRVRKGSWLNIWEVPA